MTERLWSPWRMEYIVSDKENYGCIFCDLLAEDRDEANLILHRGDCSFIMLNRYPYNSGHLMIVPYRHVPTTEDLETNEILEVMQFVNLSLSLLRSEMSPQGFNIGINMGTAAGAGIADHVHVHVVPRWTGDTNFMPVIAQTRVVPELLAETWRKLRAALSARSASE